MSCGASRGPWRVLAYLVDRSSPMLSAIVETHEEAGHLAEQWSWRPEVGRVVAHRFRPVVPPPAHKRGATGGMPGIADPHLSEPVAPHRGGAA